VRRLVDRQNAIWQVSLNGVAPSDGHDGAYAKLLYSGDDRASAPLCSAGRHFRNAQGSPGHGILQYHQHGEAEDSFRRH
jgi:hypothetical protein